MQLLNLNPEQQLVLQQMTTQIGQSLLRMNFSDPTQDEKSIRRHAYLSGKFELLNELLADDFPEPETPSQGD